MYEERRDKFSIKDILIQVLFVGIFIFLLMWLFPMKKDLKNALKDFNKDSLQPLYDQIFNNNVDTMKDAAISYYTTSRLPEKIGEEKKMTLDYMIKNSLVLPFADSDGKQCDLLDSYVSITKMSDEYILKVNLKCSEQEDYILVHLGCYNYCENGVCEKKEETPVVNPTPTPKPTPKPTPEPVVNDKYEYEYVKITDGKWGDYSEWSDWTKNVITSTDYRAVETKTEKEVTYKTVNETVTETKYDTKRVKVGTEPYTTEETVTKYKYETIKEKKLVPVTTNVPYEETVYDSVSYIIKYEPKLSCEDACKIVDEPVYGTKQVPRKVTKYKPVTTYENKEVVVGIKQVPYKTTEEVTKYRDVYETRTVAVGTEEKTITKQVPEEKQVTYYRSKTREFIKGTTDTKWSTSQNDQSLISQGYTLTGNSRKI